jgi:hypothetical protein
MKQETCYQHFLCYKFTNVPGSIAPHFWLIRKSVHPLLQKNPQRQIIDAEKCFNWQESPGDFEISEDLIHDTPAFPSVFKNTGLQLQFHMIFAEFNKNVTNHCDHLMRVFHNSVRIWKFRNIFDACRNPNAIRLFPRTCTSNLPSLQESPATTVRVRSCRYPSHSVSRYSKRYR